MLSVVDDNFSESFLEARARLLGVQSQMKPQASGRVGRVVSVALPDYRNNHLIRRLMKKMDLTREASEKLFADLLIYLAICGNYPGMNFSPTKKIDEAWHNFILFTEDYATFCQVYYGRFIHHAPNLHTGWDDVEPVRSTEPFDACIALAKKHFGELSDNWSTSRNSESACNCNANCCVQSCTGCRTS